PPASGNEPPVIGDILPPVASNFLPAASIISFRATDDNPLADEAFSITLDGTAYRSTNGLTLAGAGNSRTASLAGKLTSNVSYTALLTVVDASGVTTEQTLRFDTFVPSNLAIEVEDYNLQAGRYIDNPVPVAEGSPPSDTTYSNQEGVRDIDYSETRTGPNGDDTKYRTVDPIRMARSLHKGRQKFIDAGGTAAGVYDYDAGDLVAGEWTQYTRTIPAGSYEVYLREQVV